MGMLDRFKSQQTREIEGNIQLKRAQRALAKSEQQLEDAAQKFLKDARKARDNNDPIAYQAARNGIKETFKQKEQIGRMQIALEKERMSSSQEKAVGELCKAVTALREISQRASSWKKVQATEKLVMMNNEHRAETADILGDLLGEMNRDSGSEGISDAALDRMIDGEDTASMSEEIDELKSIRQARVAGKLSTDI